MGAVALDPASHADQASGDHGLAKNLLDLFPDYDVSGVIPPFLTGCIFRTHAAIFSFMAGVMPPMPDCPAMVCAQAMTGMLGRSVL